MDSSPDVLAAEVRAKRLAVDNDLELLRVRVQNGDPRRIAARWGVRALPVVAGAAAFWMWRRRRRAVESLQDLLVHGLTELYRTEHQLLPALDRMREAASNPDLQALFRTHAEESRSHIDRLERVHRMVGARPSSGKSAAVAGIEEEGQRLLKREADPDVRDASLIATAQRVEHLEMAGYGTARTFAATLGYTEASHLLQQTLDEERAMDEHLTRLAERFVNPQSIR